MAKKKEVCAIGIFFCVGGIVLVATGIWMTLYYMKETKNLVEEGAILAENSSAMNAWSSNEQRRLESFYVFHVTNPEEVVRFGRNITVEEKGPFVYRVTDMKTNVTLDEESHSLSYHLTKSYAFDSVSSSGLREGDIITVLNVPILSLVSKLRLNRNKEAIDELSRSNETLFTKVSVADLIWGYKSPELNRINEKFKLFNDTTIGILHQTGVPRHTRDMGEYTVSTGTDELSSVWNIKQWNNETKLSNWNSMYSNAIRGTNGYAWRPFLTSSDRLDAFDPDWCRSIYMSHEGESSVKRLSAARYALPSSVLDYSKPENKGFCEQTPEGERCLPNGVINVTSCNTERIPWILSQPCFYQADSRFAKAIHNLSQANRDRHETSLDVEMLTGEVIASRSRRQFNVFVENDGDIFNATSEFSNPIVIPVAWIDEEYGMAESERLRLEVLTFIRHSNERTRNGVIGFGLFILVIVILAIIVGFVKIPISQGRSEWQPVPSS